MTLELYHWEPSGDSAKALIGLHEAGAEFTSHYVDILKFEQYRPGYLARAPMGQVPVLVHDGNTIDEPRLLLEYLAEAFPEAGLAPTDAAGWYTTQEWIRTVDAQLNDAVRLLGWHAVMLPAMGASERREFEAKLAEVPVREKQAGWAAVVLDAESTENKLENARGHVRDALVRMERALSKSRYLLGANHSIADINAFALCWPLPKLMPDDISAQKAPGVRAWLQRMAARPAFKAAMAMRRSADDVPRFAPA